MLRRKLAYLGVSLVIVGVLVLYLGNQTRENNVFVVRDESPSKSWSYSLDYKKGQKLGFGLSTGEYWMAYEVSDEFMYGGDYIEYLPVVVTITAPDVAPGKNVTLEVEYSPIPNSPAPIPLLDVFIVKVLHKSDLLMMKTSIEKWKNSLNETFTSEYLTDAKTQNGVGTVQYSGWYVVTVSSVGLPSPPKKIVLYKYDVEVVRDYWYLIPVGAAITTVGVVTIALDRRSKPKRAHVEMLRRTSRA